MWDLVGNPEDRFSHNEALVFQDKKFPHLGLLLDLKKFPTEKKESRVLNGGVFLDARMAVYVASKNNEI